METREERPCPSCKEMVPVMATRCRFCGEDLVEDEEPRPRRRRPPPDDFQPTELLVPHNTSIWALASCYLGLLGFCLPFVGIIFAIPAVIFGIIALRKSKGSATYGAVTGNIRAIIGLVLGGLGLLYSVALLVLIAIGAIR